MKTALQQAGHSQHHVVQMHWPYPFRGIWSASPRHKADNTKKFVNCEPCLPMTTPALARVAMSNRTIKLSC